MRYLGVKLFIFAEERQAVSCSVGDWSMRDWDQRGPNTQLDEWLE